MLDFSAFYRNFAHILILIYLDDSSFVRRIIRSVSAHYTKTADRRFSARQPNVSRGTISFSGWFIEFRVMQQVRLHHFIARRLFLNMPFPVAVHPHAVTPFSRQPSRSLSSVQLMNVCTPSISRSSRVRRVMSSSLITSSSSKSASPLSLRGTSPAVPA